MFYLSWVSVCGHCHCCATSVYCIFVKTRISHFKWRSSALSLVEGPKPPTSQLSGMQQYSKSIFFKWHPLSTKKLKREWEEKFYFSFYILPEAVAFSTACTAIWIYGDIYSDMLPLWNHRFLFWRHWITKSCLKWRAYIWKNDAVESDMLQTQKSWRPSETMAHADPTLVRDHNAFHVCFKVSNGYLHTNTLHRLCHVQYT